MKQYELQQDYRGIAAKTILVGPLPVLGGGNGFFPQDELPGPEGGTNCIFESAINSNPLIFKEVVNSQP